MSTYTMENIDPSVEVTITINGQTSRHLAVKSIAIETVGDVAGMLSRHIQNQIDACQTPVK